jgi:hypothetical protein
MYRGSFDNCAENKTVKLKFAITVHQTIFDPCGLEESIGGGIIQS